MREDGNWTFAEPFQGWGFRYGLADLPVLNQSKRRESYLIPLSALAPVAAAIEGLPGTRREGKGGPPVGRSRV